MHQKPSILLLLLFLFSMEDCKKKDACASEAYEFNISPETKAWVPDDILTDHLKFQSEDGKTITLQKEPIYHGEHDWIYFTSCGGDEVKRETIYYERISYKYNSGDTLKVVMSMNIGSISCGWAGVDEPKLQESIHATVEKYKRNPTKLINIGSVAIRTKLINTSESEYICSKMYSKYNAQVQILGMSFTDVYSDDRPGHENAEFPLAEIYFQKAKGVIGFIDENGIEWLRVE